MPKVSVSVPHNLSATEALEKVQPALDKTVKDFNGHSMETTPGDNSADFKFKSMAFTISGQVRATDSDITVDVELPFAAMMFKEKTQKAISKNLTRALES
ncbi:MAG: polyhydroxyalkanoic acid system family protein [Planctomycetales bacterium]|nr:polyhydroxyalkanoic acid system family protein [Planctomycetales bacterium]